MEFRILGSTEVLDGTRRLHLPAGRGRALLALLILQAPHPVSAERLIDELWGEDPPPTAGTVVQGLVSRLRRELEPGRRKGESARVLQTSVGGYCLAIDPDTVDANRFRRLCDEARHAALEFRSATLSTALGLWRGPALADFVYEPFAQRAISGLEELRMVALEDRIEADLALGQGRELIPELELAIADHPYRERLRGFLMLALYRAGRQTEALEAFRSARSLLIDELGLEPGPALRELEGAILRHDPALELRTLRPTPHNNSRPPPSWLPGERRPVTIVAVDLAVAAAPAMDPEALGRLAERTTTVAVDVLERHGARVERLLGELLMAFFGFPNAHEDDALRAVRAAFDVRTAVEALNDDFHENEGGVRCRARMGIESGEIVVSGPGGELRDTVAGTVVTAAARLQQAAGDGQILVGPAAQRLLRGSVILMRIGEPWADSEGERAWQVVEVVSRASPIRRSLDAPMFGRQGELTRLRSAFRRAVRTGMITRVIILGEAGLGKSRLAQELIRSVGAEAHAITLRCPPYGYGPPFLPLRRAVVEAAGVLGWRALHDLLAADGTGFVSEMGDVIGLRTGPEGSDALSSAFRRLLEVLATERPLIVVLEDLHWAEPTFLDLIDSLTREATGHILMVCIGRPELIDRRPAWESNVELDLEPLSAADLEGLVIERAGSLESGTLSRIIRLSQGNPLFAEQLVAAVDEGNVDAIPASLRGLLMMRLDQLGPGERDVLRCASIAGMEVDERAVSALLTDRASPHVERHVDTLTRKGLIERTSSGMLRFRHVLIQIAAYQSMTLEDRARLHEQFARWLERGTSRMSPDVAEIRGHHLKMADEHRCASGRP